MYFPGDPLFAYDPIFNSVRDERARERMVARSTTTTRARRLGAGVPASTSCCGREATPMEELTYATTPSQTVGPYFAIGLPLGRRGRVAADAGGAIRSPGTCSTAPATPVPDAMIETWQAEPAPAVRRARLATRTTTGGTGTVKPGRATGRRRTSTCTCSRAGCCNRVVTRIYFADEPTQRRRPRLAGIGPARRRCSPSRPATATASTSTCRATVRPSSSTSELFGAVYARGAAAAAVSDARLAAGDARRRGGARPRAGARRADPRPSGRGDRGRLRAERFDAAEIGAAAASTATRSSRSCRRCASGRGDAGARAPRRDQPGRRSTRRRCSSPSARWRRCSTTSAAPPTPPRRWRARTATRRWPGARCSSRPCRPRSG